MELVRLPAEVESYIFECLDDKPLLIPLAVMAGFQLGMQSFQTPELRTAHALTACVLGLFENSVRASLQCCEEVAEASRVFAACLVRVL